MRSTRPFLIEFLVFVHVFTFRVPCYKGHYDCRIKIMSFSSVVCKRAHVLYCDVCLICFVCFRLLSFVPCVSCQCLWIVNLDFPFGIFSNVYNLHYARSMSKDSNAKNDLNDMKSNYTTND